MKMTFADLTTLAALLIALVSLITGFILQRDQKKIRDLESRQKKFQGRLSKALYAIKGYQKIEEAYAAEQGIEPQLYRRNIRKDHSEYFNTDFLSPNHIDELIREIEEGE